MTIFLLQVGTGGTGFEPLSELRHSQALSAPSVEHAIMRAEDLMRRNQAHHQNARTIVVAQESGQVVWARSLQT